MQICMKPQAEFVAMLKADIARAVQESKLSYSDIGRSANIDTSQASRICRGYFSTLSYSVLQVCKVLAVETNITDRVVAPDPYRSRIEAGVLELWDRSPEDAERIVELLRQLTELRRT
jgi:hypothetical protein